MSVQSISSTWFLKKGLSCPCACPISLEHLIISPSEFFRDLSSSFRLPALVKFALFHPFKFCKDFLCLELELASNYSWAPFLGSSWRVLRVYFRILIFLFECWFVDFVRLCLIMVGRIKWFEVVRIGYQFIYIGELRRTHSVIWNVHIFIRMLVWLQISRIGMIFCEFERCSSWLELCLY